MTSCGVARGSIIVPAWNESAVIERVLAALLRGLDDVAIDVIVACNGCTDGTPDIARRFEPRITVLDLPDAGKTEAIRAAERITDALPRLYLDADVVLTGASALAVINALDGGAIAARPPVRYDTSGAGPIVRRYYRQRLRMSSVQRELWGAGVYGLSRSARERFDEFPSVIGDDLFAARIVSPDEVTIVDCAPVVVTVPKNARSLTHTIARAHAGNRQLAQVMPELVGSTTSTTVAELVRSTRTPGQLLDAVSYAGVAAVGRLRGRRPVRTWRRDDTSRTLGA